MSVNTNFDSAVPQIPVRLPRRRSGHSIAKDTVVRVLLTTMFYIALWRATGMWYGYPANFDEGVSVDPLPMKIILYSLIPLIGLYVLLEPNRIVDYVRKAPLLIVGVTIACIASIVFSINFGASFRGFAAVFLLTAAPLLYRFRYGSVETFRILAIFAMVSAFVNIGFTIVFPQFAIMGGDYAGMIKGAFYHKNMLGQFSAACFIILISFRRPTTRMRYADIVRWTAILLTLVLVVVSRSSTAVVMVFIGLSLMLGLGVVQRVGNSAVRSAVLLFVCIAIGVLASFAYLGVAAAIAESFGKDLTFSGRTGIWEQLIPLIYDRPLFGYGFSIFRQPEVMEAYVNLSFDARSTHNTYIELALNIGLPGTIAWMVFVLARLGRKIVAKAPDAKHAEIQAKEAIIIIMILIGSFTEAGMMLAPLILWPHVVVSFASSTPARFQRQLR